MTVSGSAYLGSLNGPLQANGGLVSATTSVGYQYGGTGLTAAPSFGQILRGTGSGYSLVATSTLGINTTDLTEGSNLFWTNDRFDSRLSATTTLPNLTTLLGLTNATSTNLTATNSWLGTVRSGLWNGTSIGNQYGGTNIDSSSLTGLAQMVSGVWSASSTLSTVFGGTGWNSLQTNSILLGNGSGRISTTTAGTDGYVLALSAGVPTWLATSTLSNITGTLAVAKGGTGQTSFGQGWLNSDGTTLTSSTSPTVAYFTATSTAQASTFPYASTTALTVSGSAYLGSLNGPLQANGGLVSATTSVGYQYGGTGLTAAPSFGQILRGTGSGYSLVATSTLGINTTDLTEGSNLFWTNDRFDSRLSATTTLPNLTTLLGLTNATSTNLTATNSWLGTVRSGLWNGTSIGNQYGGTNIDSSSLTGLAQMVSGVWSASSTLSTVFGGTGWNSLQTNSILLGNGSGRISTTTAGTDGYVLALSAGVPTWLATSTLSNITGTLAVAKGGTGQTSFGQGWLNSDGTTLTSSISPTVAYFTATSTTATSTFSTGGLAVGTNQFVVQQNSGNAGIGTTGPSTLLHVSSTGSPTLTIDSTSSAGTRQAWLKLNVNNSGSSDPAGGH